jgi:hypothetical protein
MGGQQVLLEDDHIKAIKQALGAQHALHGMFADVLHDLGGKDFVLRWAEENPGRFLNLLVKMTPNLLPTSGMQGDINLTVNSALMPTDLDAA